MRTWSLPAFILMRAEETFDGQERVMSRAAYDLQVRATAHSASCGHPGFVPDDYLEHLDGLGIETTITAAELCTSARGSESTAATACWTGKPSKYVLTTYARSGERTRRPLPKAADVTWTLCMTRCISKTSPDDCTAW